MTNEEGGTDPEESRYENLVDRTNTTAMVWLSTTLACAQCHNHKYDPFSQKDYYRLLAFYSSSDYEKRVRNDGTTYIEPTLDLATDDQEESRKKLQADIDRLDKKLKTPTPALRQAQARWEAAIHANERTWTALEPDTVAATNGVVLAPQPDRSILASGPNPALTSYTLTAQTPMRGITGLRLEAMLDPSLPKNGPGRDAYGHFRITGLRVQVSPAGSPSPPRVLRVKTMKVDDFAVSFKPEELFTDGAVQSRKNGAWTVTAIRDARRVGRHAVLVPETPFGFASGTRIELRIDHLDGTIGQGLGRFRLAATTAADPLTAVELPARLHPILDTPAAERKKADAEQLTAFFLSTTPLLTPARDAITTARRKLAELRIPSPLVMSERSSFERPSYELRERASFTAEAGFTPARPARTTMRDDGEPPHLARWLVDPNKPTH